MTGPWADARAAPGATTPERVVTLDGMKKSVLTRYRVMAYVTGVLLVALTLGMIGKYVLRYWAARLTSRRWSASRTAGCTSCT